MQRTAKGLQHQFHKRTTLKGRDAEKPPHTGQQTIHSSSDQVPTAQPDQSVPSLNYTLSSSQNSYNTSACADRSAELHEAKEMHIDHSSSRKVSTSHPHAPLGDHSGIPTAREEERSTCLGRLWALGSGPWPALAQPTRRLPSPPRFASTRAAAPTPPPPRDIYTLPHYPCPMLPSCTCSPALTLLQAPHAALLVPASL